MPRSHGHPGLKFQVTASVSRDHAEKALGLRCSQPEGHAALWPLWIRECPQPLPVTLSLGVPAGRLGEGHVWICHLWHQCKGVQGAGCHHPARFAVAARVLPGRQAILAGRKCPGVSAPAPSRHLSQPLSPAGSAAGWWPLGHKRCPGSHSCQAVPSGPPESPTETWPCHCLQSNFRSLTLRVAQLVPKALALVQGTPQTLLPAAAGPSSLQPEPQATLWTVPVSHCPRTQSRSSLRLRAHQADY